MDQDHQERIRQRAHEIWESEGRPEGRDANHWAQAEQELRDQSGGEQSDEGLQAGDNSQTRSQGQQDAAQAVAPKPARKSRKSAKSESTPYLNDGP